MNFLEMLEANKMLAELEHFIKVNLWMEFVNQLLRCDTGADFAHLLLDLKALISGGYVLH